MSEQPLAVGWISSRIGLPPKDWKITTLADIAESLVDGPFGSNLKSEHYVDEPGVRVVRLQNIQEGEYNDRDPAFISDHHAEHLVRNTVIAGDVLVAALGDETYPVGRACVYPSHLPPAINKADCFRLRCNPDVALNAFVSLFLNGTAARTQVKRFEQGVTRRRTNLGNLRRVLILLPSTTEQRRIAEILSTLDEAIERTEALIGKLQQIKAGLMHDLFTRGVTPDGQLRPIREQAPYLYKQSSLGWIPNEWEVKPLTQFAASRPGCFVNGPFGSNLLTSELTDSGVPVIYSQDVKVDGYCRISNSHITEEKADELAICNAKDGDVLVAKVGNPPGIAAAYLAPQRGVITQDVIRIRPADNVDAKFLACLLNSTVGIRAIQHITIEGTRARVSLTEFKALQFPKPLLEEQLLISAKISGLQQLVNACSCDCTKLKQLKQGLMRDLLTGWVRVSVTSSNLGSG